MLISTRVCWPLASTVARALACKGRKLSGGGSGASTGKKDTGFSIHTIARTNQKPDSYDKHCTALAYPEATEDD